MSDVQQLSDMHFQKLFESLPGLYLALSPDLKLIAASDAYLKATLTSRTEVMGRAIHEVFPDNPEDVNANGVSLLRASLSTVLETKKPHAMATLKYDIRRPDGTFEERYWRAKNIPVLDDNNELRYILNSLEEMTELEQLKKMTEEYQQRKGELEKAEQEHLEHLAESEDRFLKIFNLTPFTIYIADAASGRLLYVNQAFENLFLMKSGDVIGKTVSELKITDESTRAVIRNKLNDNGGSISNIEYDVRISTGEIKRVLISIEPIDIDHKSCFLVTHVDITERKKQQDDILQLNKDIESFSYSVSHDLRAPLRAIAGFSLILEEDYLSVLDDEGKRLLKTISNNAERMGRLIDELLNFSRLGRKELHKTETNMNALVESTLSEINRSAPHNAEVIVDSLDNIQSDPGLMKQVMINLLSNAIKYSSKTEKPVVEVRSVQAGTNIIFSVKDNGVGFDMRYVDKLFGVFQRLHSDNEFPGTGVGLAIVDRIIRKHGGKVWAEAAVGKGATLYFSIPVN